MGGVVGAYIAGVHWGIQRDRRKWIFLLSDNEIIRKRDGWPDDKIAFSEIGALYDGPGALVVESAEPLRRISVPKEVNGLEVIRTELAKHHPFSAQAKPSRARLSWTGLVVMIVSILSWAAIIFICYEVMRRR